MKFEPRVLTGDDRKNAEGLIIWGHYAHSVPSGKSHYVQYGPALVVWSLPANMHTVRFILGVEPAPPPLFVGPPKPDSRRVWELSRLWAPNGHEPNLLTQAISAAVGCIQQLERPDALVSYADRGQSGPRGRDKKISPHAGDVYRAASWLYHGVTADCRGWTDNKTGQWVARRKFHSGKKFNTKSEIEAMGYTQCNKHGKERFIKPLSRAAKKRYARFVPPARRIMPPVRPGPASA